MKKTLLVEGYQDLAFIVAFLKHRGLQHLIPNEAVRDSKGVNNLIDATETLLKDISSYAAIGLMLDSDNAPKRTLYESQLQAKFTAVLGHTIDFSQPVQWVQGTKIGIWFMPDNTRHGATESLLYELIDETQNDTKPTADAFIAGLPRPLFGPEAAEIAKYYAWAALQQDPGVTVSKAFKKNLFKPDHPAADAFAAFLSGLFG